MTDKANDVLINLINRAASGVDQAIDFSKAQLPDIIHQLMVWKAVSYSLRITVFILLLIACAFFIRKSLTYLSHDKYYAIATTFTGLLAMLSIFLFVALTSNIGHALQLWLAPKVWLIEYAAQLMK
ncbi:hypothetical protein [Yersinia massiliensis]|uniref:hypothetical protein n=1 Tax=Yersinia massiliensis TaxID=419257 RepID=UPI0002D6590E|nr:hypothetical protein [Yersinia massiliensis]